MSKDEKKPRFDGPSMGNDICVSSPYDDDEEETTRRVDLAPSFSPVLMRSAPLASKASTTFRTTAAARNDLLHDPTKRKGVWELLEVPTLPEYHPLERSAVFVPHASATNVSRRISEVLRDRSIEASYDDDKAKATCVSADGVDFRVRLYRGRGSFAHGIIVEVQRRFGSSLNFYQETMAILSAAEGKAPPPPPPQAASASLPMVSDSEDDYQPSGASSLAMVAKMFSHPGYDSHYLAYQTLIPLTDASKMGLATARSVSAELLRPGNDVGTKVLALVMARKEEEDIFKLRTMAMTVLANAIQAVKGEVDMSLREELRPVLIQELYRADQNPRTAQMAGLCVEHLLQDDHDAAEFHDSLEKALEVGTARHAGLMRQAEKCLKKLRGD